uniref:Uncharacterized protein n=1 Tax=Panagrolaimus sp. ES5 TaxID=591445 RepID=A0AC34GKM3_9BILA
MMENPGIGDRCMKNISLFNETDVRCLDGYAQGHLNLEKDDPKKISYNVPQICGCTPNSGWNCTDGDYPLQDLQTFTLNTSDRIWDLTYRNISQFRLVTSKNTTGHREVILGGFTFGHENIQSLTVFEERDTVAGLETIVESLKNAS